MMNKKAFSLIELAFVLIIMGIILAGGITAFSLYVKNEKRKQTRDTVQTACEAIKGYAKNNGVLPVPVDTNGDGFLELPSDIGVQSKDAYNQFLIYNVASGIDTSNFCQNNPTLITLDDKGTTKNNVAFIIYSKSENRTNDTDCSQTPSPCSTSGVSYQIRNPDETTTIGSKYDDIVCYVDINLLRQEACPRFEITTSSFPIGTQYLTYPDSSISVVNGTLSSCSLSGTLPRGLTFNSCTLSGTPEESGTFNITITATDTIGREASKSFTITINPNSVKIETNSLPYAYVGQDYTVGLSASGATGSYTWTLIDNGGLTGLNLSSDGVLSISGANLTTTGVYNIQVKVCDSIYSTECSSKQFYLTVLSSSASSGGGSSGGSGVVSGSGCSNYEVHIIKSSFWGGDYVNSAYLGSCQRISLTRNYYTFNNITSSNIDLFTSSNCSGTAVKSYNLSSIDSDGDCKVYIACNGDVNDCKVYDTPMVYCPTAKFYDTGNVSRMKINGLGRCLNDPTVSSVADIYTYRDRICGNFLCSYRFNQEFSTLEDTDFDCDVRIDESCIISNR